MNKVVTYQSSRGARVSLTAAQEERLSSAHVWPRDWAGEECCSVYHGCHWGTPTYTDAELETLIQQLS